jgi:putative ABC transport system permease protein
VRGFARVVLALIVRPLLRETLRAALTVAGIAVGVGVLVAIQLSNNSAIRSFEGSVDAVAGRANWQIVAEAAPLDEQLLLKLQPLWDAGGRFAPVIDLEGTFEPAGIPIRVLGVDLLSDLHFRDYRYARIARDDDGMGRSAGVSDSAASFFGLFAPDSVVVPQSFATEHRLAIGSPLDLEILGRRSRLVVRGILEPTGPATAFNGSIAIVDIATAQRAFDLRGSVTRVDLLVPDDDPKALAAIRKVLPTQARLERPSRRNERVDKMLRAFRVNLFALAAVALLVGVFLVYNTVLISILRRRRDIGIVRTLGASRGQLLGAFLVEGLVFGLTGSALGLGLGVALARAILGAIGATVNALYVASASAPDDVALTPGLALVAMGIGTLASLAASLQPAIEAANTPPLALVRPGLHQRVTGAATKKLAIAAVACFVCAGLATLLPPVSGIAAGGYAAVLLVIAGTSLLCPSLLSALSNGMRPLMKRLFGVSGDLAGASLPASLRRVAVATAALSTAIGMMVAVAVMVGSFRETVDSWVAQTVKSDLWLRPARGLSNAPISVFPPEISGVLDEIDAIAAYDRFRGREIVWRDTSILVGSGDFATALERSDLPMIRPRSQDRALRAAIERRGVLISETLAYKYDLDVGKTIELPAASGLHVFPITGIYRDYSNDRGVVVMDRALWIELFHDASINTVAVFLRDGVDPEAARLEIEKRVGSRFRVFTVTNRAIRTEVLRIFDQTFMVTWALLGVAQVVAVLGIVNTLSALIIERGAEIALVRVIGVSRRQITAMLTLESAIVGLASGALGVASGWALALILIFVINRQSFGWTIEFAPPLGVVAVSVAITFLATTLAGLLPSRLATRGSLVRALKSE